MLKQLKCVLAGTIVAVFIAGGAVAGPLEEGMVAAEGGDYATALTLWRPLAEKGDSGAQYDLGVLYDEGHGVPQDYAEAVKWYQLSAEQGLAAAQGKLGFMYTFAKGVPQDYAAAAKWYKLSAEQGLATAQVALGVLYANSRGVPQDDLSAYLWFSLAAAQGDQGATLNRDMLAKLMTPAQLTEGRRLVREWKPKTQP